MFSSRPNLQKGFTLMEILIVVAIFAVLTAITLPFLNGSTDRADDAMIKQNLGSIFNEAELIYSNGNSYTALCSDPKILSFFNQIEASTGDEVVCDTNGSAWAIASELKTTGYWCIDSLGNKRGKGSDDRIYNDLVGPSYNNNHRPALKGNNGGGNGITLISFACN